MPRILVLDDSEDVLNLILEILGEVHEVVTASSWSTAFRDLTSTHFDLILLDVQLPGLQGNEIAKILTRTLARQPDHDMPKIILFSAMDKSALRNLAKECGVHGYIEKDFSNLGALKRKINRHVAYS